MTHVIFKIYLVSGNHNVCYSHHIKPAQLNTYMPSSWKFRITDYRDASSITHWLLGTNAHCSLMMGNRDNRSNSINQVYSFPSYINYSAHLVGYEAVSQSFYTTLIYQLKVKWWKPSQLWKVEGIEMMVKCLNSDPSIDHFSEYHGKLKVRCLKESK